MKIAISGKGGAGKTTISALLCRAIEAQGREVIAVDADSNPNLACALGLPDAERITPLSEMRDLIREKTGSEKGGYGAWFKMNPDVSDIPERFRHVSGKVQLLVMGAITRGDSGCACPEYVLVKSLISYLLLNEDQDMVIDMEAGLEHLGRGVTSKVDVLLIIAQPSRVDCLTASRVYRLAKDLGIKTILGVGNAIRSEEDIDYLRRQVRDFDFAAFFPSSESLRENERRGGSTCAVPAFAERANKLVTDIAGRTNG